MQNIQGLTEPEVQTKRAQGLGNNVAWYGSTEIGNAAYYSIHGPTLWIEYAPQPMGDSETEHTHAMYRDLSGDYGAGWLE